MSKFSCFFFFGNPTTKTVTRTAYMWGLLIANHLDQSLRSTNSAVRSNLLHSFLKVHNCVAPFYQPHKFGAETISWAKPAHFDFLAIKFTVWSQALITVADALSLELQNCNLLD